MLSYKLTTRKGNDVISLAHQIKRLCLMIGDYTNVANQGDIIAGKLFASYPDVFCTEVLLYQAEALYEELLKVLPNDVFEAYNTSDTVTFTDKFYHRQYWNEIENPCIVEAILDIFAYQNNMDDEKKYQVRIYDIGDYPLNFNTKEEMYAFVDEYNCAPYSLFELKGGWYEEIVKPKSPSCMVSQ